MNEERLENIIVALIVIVIGGIGFGIAKAQVTTDPQCQTAQVTEFGNIVINESGQFFNQLLSQANADLMSKAQTDAAIQAGESDDEVKIATASAALSAIANCVANQQTNQVNGT